MSISTTIMYDEFRQEKIRAYSTKRIECCFPILPKDLDSWKPDPKTSIRLRLFFIDYDIDYDLIDYRNTSIVSFYLTSQNPF